MIETRFRFLVVWWIVLYVWLFSLPSSAYKQPAEIRELLGYSGRGAVLPPSETLAYLILGAYLAAAAGLLAWQPWARKLLTALLVVWIVLRALRGIAVVTAFGSVLGAIFTLLTGVIVALIYTAPLAMRFAAAGPIESPLSSRERQFSEGFDEELIAVCEIGNPVEIREITAVLASAGVAFIMRNEATEEQIERDQSGEEDSITGPVRVLVRAEDVRAARALLSVFRLRGT